HRGSVALQAADGRGHAPGRDHCRGWSLCSPPSREAAGRRPCQREATGCRAGDPARRVPRPRHRRDQHRLLRPDGVDRRARGGGAAPLPGRPHGRPRSAHDPRSHASGRERSGHRALARGGPGGLHRLSPVDRVLFDHIAIALPRMAAAAPFLCAELGGEPDAGQPSGVFAWGTYRFEGGGSIEIMEPAGPSGFLHRFLAERGAGIHHVTFKVPSLAEACARAESTGYDIIGRDESDPEWKEAFLHPKQALGIVVQFAESGPPHAGSRPMVPPQGLPGAPPPVTILGLRMRGQSVERAVTQWTTVLQGTAAEGPRGELVFSWRDSPMRLAVEIDPVQDEGPIALEL